ncbi:hypothetical protein B5C26_00165 [Photorhabdus luminescens]|nr:hypothetical protein B5C26_00165 [Photorhabdus luminescens]
MDKKQEQAVLNTLVQIAGCRWEIECGFEKTKGECGLDHYEVQQWKSRYRHIALSYGAYGSTDIEENDGITLSGIRNYIVCILFNLSH